MSSRIAVCGQAPVSTATMRESSRTAWPAQEIGVFGRVDVVGHDAEAQPACQRPAQASHQRGLSRTDRPADPDPRARAEPAGGGRSGCKSWLRRVYVVMRQRGVQPVRRGCSVRMSSSGAVVAGNSSSAATAMPSTSGREARPAGRARPADRGRAAVRPPTPVRSPLPAPPQWQCPLATLRKTLLRRRKTTG